MKGYDAWKCYPDDYYEDDSDNYETMIDNLLKSIIITDTPHKDSIQCGCCKKHFSYDESYISKDCIHEWLYKSMFDYSDLCSEKCVVAYDKECYDEYFEENNDLETSFDKLLGWNKVTA